MLKSIFVKVGRVDATDRARGIRRGHILEGFIDEDGDFVYGNGNMLFKGQFSAEGVAQKDELVLVKDGEDHDWEARYFSHIEGDKIHCFKYSFTSEKTQETETWAIMQRIKFID